MMVDYEIGRAIPATPSTDAAYAGNERGLLSRVDVRTVIDALGLQAAAAELAHRAASRRRARQEAGT